uniref:Uncharacterized protein n=1 Tax=Quercus lobata TaxID=97700 RepID=A0A7N2N7R9_QUELO
MLLWCSAKYLSPTGEINVFYAAAVILVVGMAGQDPPQRAFLADQLSDEVENPTEEKQEEIDDRTDILWRVARFSGATIALVSLPNSTWMGNGLRSFRLADGSKSFAILVWLWSLLLQTPQTRRELLWNYSSSFNGS